MTTTLNVMQQALAALVQIKEADTAKATPKMVIDARALYAPTIAALESAIARPEQPATAWRMRAMDGEWMFCSKESYDFCVEDGLDAQQLFVRLPAAAQPDIKKLVQKVHKAKGRYHSQIAMCDLYDACNLLNVRPAV